VIHYHGTPITPRERLLELAGRHFCVPFSDRRDARVCHEIGQSVMLDNGAYSVWTKRDSIDSFIVWDAWKEWADEWLDYPTTWCILPDSIDGGREANDRLLRRYRSIPKGAPVWHLDEPLDRLRELADGFERLCFGSSGAYRDPGTDRWHRRISEAFDTLADWRGRVPWVHMLRAMNEAAGSHYPFASADSTNAARNHAGSWKARPKPITQIVAEGDARQCAARWRPRGTQTEMEVA
jgi:hypothetical protein